MAHLAGKAGNVYIADLLLEDCEDAWTSGTHGTASLETSLVKVGDGSAKCVIASPVAGDYVMYEGISSKDVSSYTHLLFWARCTASVAAGDFRIVLDHDAGAPASPQAEVDVPALTADTWKYCHGTEVAGKELDNATAAVTIGLEFNANPQDCTIYLDDIRAAKNIAGIKSWTLEYTTDVLETTDFADSGVRSYIPGCSQWSGSFEGYKDGAPLSVGTQVGLELAESGTTTQMWLGNAIITAVRASVSFDGVVSYSYDFQGTGELTVASA